MKMELLVSSETSALKAQRPGDYPKDTIRHSTHGESFKSRLKLVVTYVTCYSYSSILKGLRLLCCDAVSLALGFLTFRGRKYCPHIEESRISERYMVLSVLSGRSWVAYYNLTLPLSFSLFLFHILKSVTIKCLGKSYVRIVRVG